MLSSKAFWKSRLAQDSRLLIVVDQFDELDTLTTDQEARRRFLNSWRPVHAAVSKADGTQSDRAPGSDPALQNRATWSSRKSPYPNPTSK